MSTKLDTLFPKATLYHFSEIDSTNKFALELIAKSLPSEGTTISADFQTHGRGQYGRTWQSESTKNLLCSIILYPTFIPVIEQFALSRMAAIAIHSTISHFLPHKLITIKWPNDIFCNGKKISGILIQNIVSGKNINASVFGFGVNVNQKIFSEAVPATSVSVEKKEETDIFEFRDVLIENIKNAYDAMKIDQESQFRVYNDLLYKKGEIQYFELNDSSMVEAKILFTNIMGHLVVDINGSNKSFDLGALKWKI